MVAVTRSFEWAVFGEILSRKTPTDSSKQQGPPDTVGLFDYLDSARIEQTGGEAQPLVQSSFEGKLIRLRAREPEDEPLLFQWFNDAEVTEFLSMRYPLSHVQEKEYVERTSAIAYSNASFAVETLSGGRLIGGGDLRTGPPEDRHAELGIALGDKASWDGGYGTDTMRTLCRVGFNEMNLHRIELWVFAENTRARHVYEKVGFREEGVRRDAFFRRGRYGDMVLMSLLETEFVEG